MPQAGGVFIPVTGFIPKYTSSIMNLECQESDTDLFEEAQPAGAVSPSIELPLSQGSTLSNLSQNSDYSSVNSSQERGDIDYLMDAVQHHYSIENMKAPQDSVPSSHYSQFEDNLVGRLNPVTPTKPREETLNTLDPLTPTANLKMLVSAVSPEIRNREKEQRESVDEINTEITIEPNNNNNKSYEWKPVSKKGTKRKASHSHEEAEEEDTQATGRKEKSLGLLCQRFMAKYSEFPNPQDKIEICLDGVAKDLGVERRRIYDIVNVLESVEIMSRMAKNKYKWHGRTNLLSTLAKLKALGCAEGFSEQIEKIKDYELSRDLQASANKRILSNNDANNVCSLDNIFKDGLRKDRSLGIMSQRFLMLFLVAKNQAINLDLAAKILIGDPNIDKTETGKFKTQIRRLYDIANIFTSLDLIRKVHITEVRGRKPAFKYVGPTVGEVSDTSADCTNTTHKNIASVSRSSLLNCSQNAKACGMPSSKQSLRRTMSQQVIHNNKGREVQPTERKFSRHASFEMMCEIAEGERKRLYYESETEKAVSLSQPTSPLKDKMKVFKNSAIKSDVARVKNNLLNSLLSEEETSPVNKSPTVKHFVVIRQGNQSNSKSSETSPSGSNCSQDNANFTSPPVYNTMSLSPSEVTNVHAQGDQILLKAHLSHPSLPDKQPTLLKLSKAQLQSVFKSMGEVPDKTTGPVVTSSDYKVVTTTPTGLATTQVQMKDGSKVQVLHANKQVKSPEETEGGFLVSPPDLSRIRSIKRPLEQNVTSAECYFDAKRPKKEVEPLKPVSIPESGQPVDSEVATINSINASVNNATKHKPSPLRALHLEPEFQAKSAMVSSSESVQNTKTTMQEAQSSISTSRSISTQDAQSVLSNSMAAPKQAPLNIIRHRTGLIRSKSASPSTFMFGSKGVGSLQSDNPGIPKVQQCTFITSPSGVISPLTGSTAIIPQAATNVAPFEVATARVISSGGYQITPTSSLVKPARNIVPSSGAIVNLVPRLVSEAPQESDTSTNVPRATAVPVSVLGGTRILARKLSADHITSLRAQQGQLLLQQQQPTQVLTVPYTASSVQAQTQFFKIDTQNLLQTPNQQQQSLSSNSPASSHITPTTQLATPKSFFQSTPSGSLIRITTHQISPENLVQQQQGVGQSAFRVVNGQTFRPVTETVTARRLTLSAENTP